MQQVLRAALESDLTWPVDEHIVCVIFHPEVTSVGFEREKGDCVERRDEEVDGVVGEGMRAMKFE